MPEHGQGELDDTGMMTSKAIAFSSFPWLRLCKRELQRARESLLCCRDKCTELSKSQGAAGLDLHAVLITGS